MKFKLGICDDDAVCIAQTCATLDRYIMSSNIDISYQCFSSGEALLNAYKTAGDFHVLFLDIKLPGIDGITLAQQIKKTIDKHVFIIFLSFYNEYMYSSFGAHPYCYLIKPLQDEILCEVMQEIEDELAQTPKYYTTIAEFDRLSVIDIRELRYIAVQNAKKELLSFRFFDHTITGKGKLSDWEKKLRPYHFTLCCRGFLINLAYIRHFQERQIIMDNADRLPLSRSKGRWLKELFSSVIALH